MFPLERIPRKLTIAKFNQFHSKSPKRNFRKKKNSTKNFTSTERTKQKTIINLEFKSNFTPKLLYPKVLES